MYLNDRSEYGDGSRYSDFLGFSEDGWYIYSKDIVWSDNDDEDYWIINYRIVRLFNMR